MNWNTIEGNWKEIMGSARERWGLITHSEMTEIGGKKDQLEGLIQKKYGLSQEHAAKQIDEWSKEIKSHFKKEDVL